MVVMQGWGDFVVVMGTKKKDERVFEQIADSL